MGVRRPTHKLIWIVSIQRYSRIELFLVSDSEKAIYISGDVGHQHKCWLAIARQEKIAILMKINGYNP